MKCPYCKEEIQDGATKCKHCYSNIGAVSGQTASGGPDDFGELIGGALKLWQANLGDLAVLTLVFILVVWIPIANIGFIAGYIRSLIKVARGQGKAEVGDLFKAWDCFGNLFIYLLLLLVAAIVLHIVPLLGSLASMALGFAAMPGVYAIIDGKLRSIAAFKWSLETIRANVVNWLLAYLAGYVIAMAGLVLLFIGVILSAPLGLLILIRQYERVKPV